MRCPYCQDEHAAGTYVCPKTQHRITGILPEGTVVDGKYKIIGVLGTGGMAAVYRAEHVKIGRIVALKTLLPEFVAYPELVARVDREAKAAGGVDHPNVVQIVDLGSTPEYGPYIAMELLKGMDLATYVENHGNRLDAIEAAQICKQVLAALAAAHEKGVIHRDLKPENIFLAEDDDRLRVKVLDFGISKVAVEGKLSSLTRTGTVLGTPQFMAPEQAAGLRDQDARVDIYSCGVVLYAVMTGHLPYEAENYNLLINEILNKPPKPILTWDPTIDPVLADIVMHSLARSPKDRYPSAKAMQDDVVGWLELHGTEIESSGRKRIATAPTIRASSISARGPSLQRSPTGGARVPSSPNAPKARISVLNRPKTGSAIDDEVTSAIERTGTDDEPTTSLARPDDIPVPIPTGENPTATASPKPLRSNTHTPLGWENTPAGITLPPQKSGGRAVFFAVLALVLATGGAAFAARAFAPDQWNQAVRSVGLGTLAVANAKANTSHAAATSSANTSSHSSGSTHHSASNTNNVAANNPEPHTEPATETHDAAVEPASTHSHASGTSSHPNGGSRSAHATSHGHSTAHHGAAHHNSRTHHH